MTVNTAHRSRLLALGLLLVAVIIVLAAILYPWMSAHAVQAAEIRHMQKQLQVYRSLSEGHASMQQELSSLQRRNPSSVYYVSGETPALASASMQKYIKQIVDQQGGELISTQAVKDEGSDGPANIRLKVNLRSDMNASSRILYQLESGRPLLFTDNVTISARLVRGASAGDSPRISLDTSFDVTGYLAEDRNEVQ